MEVGVSCKRLLPPRPNKHNRDMNAASVAYSSSSSLELDNPVSAVRAFDGAHALALALPRTPVGGDPTSLLRRIHVGGGHFL